MTEETTMRRGIVQIGAAGVGGALLARSAGAAVPEVDTGKVQGGQRLLQARRLGNHRQLLHTKLARLEASATRTAPIINADDQKKHSKNDNS